ncbi:MAG TPA: L,D-transpeptidase [Xanthobacteraceae bacterium]|nr:L,D-transpeptidase [Xanthobacteraceae bacterium]
MRRVLVSALLISASCLPAGADPLQITPGAYASGQRVEAAATSQPPAAVGRQRYVSAGQPNLGGGFIEFLFGGAARQAAVERPYQPSPPDYPWQPLPQQDALRTEPMPISMPAGLGGMAHAPVDPKYDRQMVDYRGKEQPGTIIIDTPNRFLYLVEDSGKALRYGIGVGRPGFTWAGVKTITAMREWPDWRPPDEMIARRPDLPRYMAGGPENPLGARALYLGSTLYRIHGSNEPWTIGAQVSSGCIRMRNDDVTDLYDRVKIGTKVVVM